MLSGDGGRMVIAGCGSGVSGEGAGGGFSVESIMETVIS